MNESNGPLRIGYFGDGEWAQQSLDWIADDPSLEIVLITGRYNTPDPALKDRAKDMGVPFFAPEDVNATSFLEEVRSHEPDVNVSMSYDQILRREAITLAPLGFINCHAGALPFYRGRNILNWALINGEEQFGVTVHYVDEEIDTGDIITQKFGAIESEDDYGSLLSKAVDLCAEALLEALREMRDGQIAARPQEDIHPVGFYSSARREGDEWIDWSQPTERIHNLVRGLAPPGPGARTLHEASELVILKSELIPAAPEYIDRPGTVVGKRDGIIVKTGTTTLRVKKIADWEGEVVHPRTPDYRIGTTFGINPGHQLRQMQQRIRELEARLNDLESEKGE